MVRQVPAAVASDSRTKVASNALHGLWSDIGPFCGKKALRWVGASKRGRASPAHLLIEQVVSYLIEDSEKVS